MIALGTLLLREQNTSGKVTHLHMEQNVLERTFRSHSQGTQWVHRGCPGTNWQFSLAPMISHGARDAAIAAAVSETLL